MRWHFLSVAQNGATLERAKPVKFVLRFTPVFAGGWETDADCKLKNHSVPTNVSASVRGKPQTRTALRYHAGVENQTQTALLPEAENLCVRRFAAEEKSRLSLALVALGGSSRCCGHACDGVRISGAIAAVSTVVFSDGNRYDGPMNGSNTENTGSKQSTGRLSRVSVLLSVVLAIGLIFSSPPENMTPEALRLIAVVVLMAGLWVTQVIPLAATSLLPLVLFPLFGIQAAKAVSGTYINDQVFLYLGGFIIALGIERWQLHTRIALHIVRLVGVSPRRLVLGFMLATAGMSMWISNTASALLMLPIGLALLKTLSKFSPATAITSKQQGGVISEGLGDRLAVPLLLGIAYAASLGGMTSIIGTPTNNQAVGVYHKMFPDLPELTVANWLMACLPIGVIYLGLAWVVLTWKLPKHTDTGSGVREVLRSRLKDLGSPKPAELRMLAIFVLTASLWVFRKPLEFGSIKLLVGWSEAFPAWVRWLGVSDPVWADSSPLPSSHASFVNDSTISMLMAFVLFCIPSGTRDENGKSVRLMDWDTASRLPWDVVLLVGSGFALASAFGETGLSEWAGLFLQKHMQDLPLWLVIACVCLLMTFLTEFTSNVATVSTLMPTIGALCLALDVDPRMVMVPAALATSCAFMLPIATPPNAIVFGSGRIPVREMVRYGVLLNLVGVPVLTAATWLFIKPILGIP